MAKEDQDSELLGLGKILSSVVSKDAESRKSSSVIRNSEKESEEVRPNLTSPEKERLKEIVKILGKELKIGTYQEKPEAERLKDLTPTAAKQPPPIPTSIGDKVKKPLAENKLGWLDALGLLGGLSALAYMFKDEIKKFWDKHKDKIKDVLKSIGGEINKFWENNKGEIKQVFKNIMAGVFSALIGAIEWAWGESSTTAKTRLIQSALKTKAAQSVINTGIKAATAGVGALSKAATSSSPGKVTNKVIQEGVEDFSKFAKPGGVTKTAAAIERLGKMGSSATGYAAEKAASILGKNLPILLKAVGGVGKLLKGILKFPLLAETVELGMLTKQVGDERKKYDNGEITLEQLRETVGALGLNSAGGIIGGNAGKIGGYMLGAGLGTLISGGAIVGTGGAAALASPALIAMVQALGMAGSVGGAFAGDMAGRWVANLVSGSLQTSGPGALQDVGDNILDLHSYISKGKKSLQGNEMQDFMVKGNNVYKFNTKDEFIGLKTGGAIDNVFKDLTEGISKDNSVIKDASIAQVNRLDHLIELMQSFLQKSSSQGGGTINTSTGGNNYTPSTVFDLRQQFTSQTLLT